MPVIRYAGALTEVLRRKLTNEPLLGVSVDGGDVSALGLALPNWPLESTAGLVPAKASLFPPDPKTPELVGVMPLIKSVVETTAAAVPNGVSVSMIAAAA